MKIKPLCGLLLLCTVCGSWLFAQDSVKGAKQQLPLNFSNNHVLAADRSDLRVYADAAEYHVCANEYINIDFKIDALEQYLRAYELVISFDPGYLELENLNDITEGTFLTEHGISQWYAMGENATYTITGSILGVSTGVLGSGTLFTMRLKAKNHSTGGGGTPVNIASAILRGPLNESIEIADFGSAIVQITAVSYAEICVFLEGAYSGERTMRHDLSAVLPLASPYDAEQLTALPDVSPNYIVDWLRLELRSDLHTPSGQAQNAFLLQDGTVISLRGDQAFAFDLDPAEEYYLVIRHRNHLALMSAVKYALANSLESPTEIDLSREDSCYGLNNSGFKHLGGGVYALYAGDADQDGKVFPTDSILYWEVQTGQSGYLSADFNLDTNVYPSDNIRFWGLNSGKQSYVP